MAHFEHDRFYRYDELTRALHALARSAPQLVTLSSIGSSHEGREIWLATLTNRRTGEAADKPALWVDGNIHSIEVSASTACLYFIDHLVDGHGRDADVTRALDSRAFYICPRLAPDGAEWALADTPRYVRSSTRSYPPAEPRIEGYEPRDIDGDGRILRLRIRDPQGHWKVCARDPRLMVRRDPAESGGDYYRVIPEGEFIDPAHADLSRIRIERPAQALDLNRNFPGDGWRQEFEQRGAGDFPTSEPEVRAVARFFAEHANITGGVTFHTFSGVLLRPFGTRPDKDMAAEDLWVYKEVGRRGQEWTGYPAIGVYEEFRYHPNEVITGTFDWIYDHLGIYAWTVELWSPMREAGIEKYPYIDWFRDHPEDDDLKLLAWNDEALGGRGFVPWRPYVHPTLGEVEIGGWDTFACISNVPRERLAGEVAKFPKWLVWQALISPRLEVRAASATRLGPRLYKVRLELQNTGYLPTTVSRRAADRRQVRPLIAELTLPDGARILQTAGNSTASHGALPRIELGQLTGWSHKQSGMSFWPDAEPMSDIAVAEWIVSASPGTRAGLSAHAPRSGRVGTSVVLD
jgi:murein tripeptide amidase MpaA